MESKHRKFTLFQNEEHRAKSIQAGPWRITPITRTLHSDYPARLGGVIWNRPTGVLVQANGEDTPRWLPILDVTRRAQIAIWAGTAAAIMVAMILFGRRSER